MVASGRPSFGSLPGAHSPPVRHVNTHTQLVPAQAPSTKVEALLGPLQKAETQSLRL